MNFINSNIFSIFFKPNYKAKSTNTSVKADQDFKINHCQYLHENLKQLEFISCFEMHLDKKNEDTYPLSFLQELANIKHFAQLNTIQSIEYCKK